MNPFMGGLQGPGSFGRPTPPILDDLMGQMRSFRQQNEMVTQGLRQNLATSLAGFDPFAMPFRPPGFLPGMELFGQGGMFGPQGGQIGGPFAQQDQGNYGSNDVEVRQEDDEDSQYKQAYEDLLDQMEEQEEPTRSSSTKGLTKTDLDKAYKSGMISADDYTQGLIDYGLSPEDASLRSAIYGPEGEGNRKSGQATGLNLTDLRKGFKLGRISYEEYITQLTTNKNKSIKEAEEMARADMGLAGAYKPSKALAVSPKKRNEWRKLYLAREGKIKALKKTSPAQKMYADARKWAQQFKTETDGAGTFDGYLAFTYGKLANKASAEDASDTLNAQPSVYSMAFKDAFEGKKGYVKPKEKGKPVPAASKAKRQALVKEGKRSFVNDENQKAFLAYKKKGGKLGPKSWYQARKKEQVKKAS